jgi:amino acid permease
MLVQGCGFLGVPYAFVKSGMVVGPILVIFFAYMCNVSKDYILETLGRLEALEKVWCTFFAQVFCPGFFRMPHVFSASSAARNT